MRINSRPAIIGAVVGLLVFGGTRALQGQQETGAVPSDTAFGANPGTQAGQMNDNSTYAPPSSDTTSIYAPPRSDSGTYAPPDSATYAPPRSDSGTYAPPDSATYAPPDSAIYGPPNNPASAPPQDAAARTWQDSRETLLGATLGNPRLIPE